MASSQPESLGGPESPDGVEAHIPVSDVPADPLAAGHAIARDRVPRDVTSPLMSFWALVLAACGGGGGGGGGGGASPPVTTNEETTQEDKKQPTKQREPVAAAEPGPLIAGRVVNGPVGNARVYLDINDDGELDDDDLHVGTTDSGGRFEARSLAFKGHEDKALLVNLAGATFQPHPLLVGNAPGNSSEPSGILRAPPGSEVVTPLTELLVQIHGHNPTPAQIEAFSARFGLGDRLITETDPFAPSLMAENPQLAAKLQAAARRVSEMLREDNDHRQDNRPDEQPSNQPADPNSPEEMLGEAAQAAREAVAPAITVTVEQRNQQIHENFPTSKSVYTAPEGYELVEGYGDNHLFQLAGDGRLFFDNMPDFEAPGDLDQNNIYQLRLIKRVANNEFSYINLSVSVVDLRHELYTPQPIGSANNDEAFMAQNAKPVLNFSKQEIFDQGLPVPGALTQYLLSGVAWRMPEQGPLVLTWSLVTDTNRRLRETAEISRFPHKDVPNSFIRTQAQIDQARRYIEAVLAEYERAANVRFVEVEHSQHNRGDVPITYLFLPEGYEHIAGTPGAWAGYPGAKARFVQLFKPWEPYTHYRGEPVHEIGHVMGLRHPFQAHGQGQTIWDFLKNLETDTGTIMSYAWKPNWVGLTKADIEVLRFLYGAPQVGQAGTQRPEIETRLGERPNDRRPPAEQVFPQDEPLPAPQFQGGAQVMTVSLLKYPFIAGAASAELEIHYFIVRTGNQVDIFKVYGFPAKTLKQHLSVKGGSPAERAAEIAAAKRDDNDTDSAHVSFDIGNLLEGRLLHKQQLVAVVIDPDKPAVWSQSFKWVFVQWPTIEVLAAPSKNLRDTLGIVYGVDDKAEIAKKHAIADAMIRRLLRKEEIKDDAPIGEKIADLSAYPNAKLIWKGTGSQFLQGVDPEVDAEIFPILSDADFFEIRNDGGLYVSNAPLDHDNPQDRGGDNNYDLFIEYGEAGAEKHVAFRITVTDEAFEEAVAMSQMAMSQMVVSMDVTRPSGGRPAGQAARLCRMAWPPHCCHIDPVCWR